MVLASASHVVILLVKKYPQYKIVNFDKLDYCSSLKNLDEIESYPNYTFVKGDITSSDLVNFVLEAEKVDTIMHFAAQTHVGTTGHPRDGCLDTCCCLITADVAHVGA